jgi:hypothetical protein
MCIIPAAVARIVTGTARSTAMIGVTRDLLPDALTPAKVTARRVRSPAVKSSDNDDGRLGTLRTQTRTGRSASDAALVAWVEKIAGLNRQRRYAGRRLRAA